jgi:glutathione synthase/RimK-type ligase-like ATP-grasp enzyme
MTAYLLRRRKLGKTSCNAISQFSKQGIKVVLNDRDPIPAADVCIRWGCTANVPQRTVINKAEAIHRVSDKSGFRRILNDHDLCPSTWGEGWGDAPSYPCVVRPRTHHQGRHLYFCRDDAELSAARRRAGEGWYAGAFIRKVAEYRVFCANGRAIAVASKTPANPEAVAWNVAQGGRFDNVRWEAWPLKAVKTSLEAFALSGLDFGGVDIMVDAAGGCYVLEINAAPSLTSPYRQECMSKALDWMLRVGRDTIPLIPAKGGYLKFIHPAISPDAKV